MKVLIRLPNWLGDLVMSSAFIRQLQIIKPECVIDVIVKEELVDAAKYINGIRNIYPFSRKRNHGLSGAIRFAREIVKEKPYDYFFSLPDSFSSAFIGYLCSCKVRVGYSSQMRSLLLTHPFKKPSGIHRVDEYVNLLNLTFKPADHKPRVELSESISDHNTECNEKSKGFKILLNVNSEAASRKIPEKTATSLCRELGRRDGNTIIMTGTNRDSLYVKKIIEGAGVMTSIVDLSGKTTLRELIELCKSVDLVITSDSGIAHLANSFEKNVVVLFGAGNELNTAPYNSKGLTIIRAQNVPCAPCVSNMCKYKNVKCMTEISIQNVFDVAMKLLDGQ
jgi:heptosyltransferase II